METNMQTRNPRYCFQCDDGTILVHDTRDVADEVDGEPFTVEQISGWHCPVCGEIEFDLGSGGGARYSAALKAAAARADARRAQQLRATRKKLKLTQAEAGHLFGGGMSAFSEYERGKTQPHKSTVLLLRLLDRHPELLSELT
jgi:HTH-type transcriptional regulator/antitoxin MqsA